MKFVKGFLVSILTVLIAIAIFVLGIVLNFKATLIDTMDVALKNELSKEIVDLTKDITNKNPEDIKKEVDKVLKENKNIKKILDSSYDEILAVIEGEKIADLDISLEIEELVDETVEVLKDYDINLTDDDKKEIMNIVNSADVNDNINTAIGDLAKEISAENKTALDVYNFITGTTFKIILIGVIIICVALIALIKKSVYKWLIDLGVAGLTVGATISFLIPMIIDWLMDLASENEGIVISVTSLTTYGYIWIGIGLVAVVGNFVLNKVLNKEKVEN